MKVTCAMPKCTVKNCKSNSLTSQKKDGVSYFHFPRNPIRCAEWTAIIAQERREEYFKPNKSTVICSLHFDESNIYTTNKGLQRLSKHAKPTIRIGNVSQIIEYEDIKLEMSTRKSSSNEESEDNDDDCEDSNDADKTTHVFVDCKPLEISVTQEEPSRTEKYKSLRRETILDALKKQLSRKEQELNRCRTILTEKNKKLDTLRKQNKRLKNRNVRLKSALAVLSKQMKIRETD